MTVQEYVGAWKQVVDYYLEQTAEERQPVIIHSETQETQTRGISDATIRQVIELHLQNPDWTTNQLGTNTDSYVNRWLVGEILRAGKYKPTGKLTASVERLRKRLIELGLMSKNPVWD